MRHVVVLCVTSVWLSWGARLEHTHSAPAGAQLAGGAGAGLHAPPPSAAHHHAAHAHILRYENDIDQHGYHYAYETSDGTKAEQEGRVVAGAREDEGSLQVAGSYSYVGADGRTYAVTYTADERGFRADGAHLPTAPPPPSPPQHLLRSLELAHTKQDQYSSHKSSYDADAGL